MPYPLSIPPDHVASLGMGREEEKRKNLSRLALSFTHSLLEEFMIGREEEEERGKRRRRVGDDGPRGSIQRDFSSAAGPRTTRANAHARTGATMRS